MKINLKPLDYTKLSIIIILTGIIIRFYLASIHHVAGDACWQLSNSRFIAENLKIPLFEQFGRDEPFWAPPLFHMIAAFVYMLFKSEFAVKMISPVFGSLSLILFLVVAKKLFGKKIAFYSILFLTFVPLHLDYSVFSYIDGMLAFLVLLSVYFALNNKIAASGIAAGIAILTKYNGIFILPALFYIVYENNRNRRIFLKKVFILSLISLLIGSVWFARNWHYLGNPVWPFMNSFFNGIEVSSFHESSVGAVKISNIFNVNAAKSIYLGIFGVPDGNINALYFFKIPYINLLFAVWFFGTIIFSIPLFMGFISKRLKYRKLLFIWIIAYIILALLYVINASWSVSRFLLPAFPAAALIWGHGIENFKLKKIPKEFLGCRKFQNFLANKKVRNIFAALVAIIIIGFLLTSFIKINLAAKAWDFYNDDFSWVKLHTSKNAVFLSESQCISYNVERQTVTSNIKNLENADYIFVNQNFKLDSRAVLSKDVIEELNRKNTQLVYENKKSSTKIYKIVH